MKELISGLPNYGSMETFGARAETRNVLMEKTAADVLPCALIARLLAISVYFCGQCNTGATDSRIISRDTSTAAARTHVY